MIKILWFAISLVVALNISRIGFAAVPQGQISSKHFDKNLSDRTPEVKHPPYKEDEIIVKFREGVTEDRRYNLHARKGTSVVKEFKRLRMQHLKLKSGVDVPSALEIYKKDPDVEYAEPNYQVKIQALPNDPMYSFLWGMAKISAPAAWNLTTGSSDVVVAVIDTGIDYNHPDLAANVWVNPNESAGNSLDDDNSGYIDDVHGINTLTHSGDPMDDHGHGTHVAGIIGAVGNNGVGVVGTNWNVKILGCKFADVTGNGYVDGAIACLNYIKSLKDSGVNIAATNNSWGSNYFSQALYDAINAQQDILFVAASGNNFTSNDGTACYPASYKLPNIISVSATDENEQLASFSNYGKRSVHVGSPGVSIYSTMSAVNAFGLTGGYGNLSGTSMAAPYVTGLGALLKTLGPNRDIKSIKNLILAGGDSVSALDGKTIIGKRINAYGSLNCINNPTFAVLYSPTSVTVGVPVVLSAMSINCAEPTGPVTVTTGLGETISLSDDGIYPDDVAGDGIFSGMWTPSRTGELLTFTSAAGTKKVEAPPLRIDTAILPEANIAVHYNALLSASGGGPGYSWALSSGTLPVGLTLNGSTGLILGDSTAVGRYPLTFKVTDSFGMSTEKSFILYVTIDALAQEWATTLVNLDDEQIGKAVAVDGAGNSYVVGTNYNVNKRIILKYGTTGNLLWSRSSSGFPGNAIAVDKSGFIYVTGGFNATEKYDPAGNLLWTSYSSGYGNAIATDAFNNVYIAGRSGNKDFFVIKYDNLGNVIWEKTYDNGATEAAYGVACDKTGNVYVTGIGYSVWPDSLALTIKYDPDGNLLWARTHKSTKTDWGRSIAVDDNGNAYIAGDSAVNPQDTNFMVIKYDTLGNLLWSKSYLLPNAHGNGITVDSAGNSYMTGDFYPAPTRDCSIIKYNPDGDILWAKTYDGGTSEYCNGIALGTDSSIYIAGESWVNFHSDMMALKFRETQTQSIHYSPLGTGTGTVLFSPGASCNVVCSQTYPRGAQVTLYPTADDSSVFTGWGGDCSGTGACVFTMDAGKTVTATFTAKIKYPLSVKLVGSGYIEPDAGYYSCDQRSCSGSFNAGTTVTLTAYPYYGYKFSGWSGACSGTGTCTITMTSAKSATATFTLLPTKKVSVQLSGSGKGAISSDPPNKFTCRSTSCSGSYPLGTSVTLTETPTPYSGFAGWSGACSGTYSTCTFTATMNLTVGAKFNIKVFNLAVNIAGTKGSVYASPRPNGMSMAICSTGTCSYPYNALTGVKLTAAPAPGYKLVGWSGACTGSSLSCTVTMDGDKEAIATFGLK